MSNISKDITELIGNTPLVEISRFNTSNDTTILAKLELFNPLGSIKDRVAYNMINVAEKEGKIRKNTIIIEPTSGNTGIGLSYIASIKGYRIILTMPDTMSIERQKLLKALGAELVLTDGTKGMNGAIEKAYELAHALPNTYIPQQFENQNNPDTHYNTTAEEILRDTDGKVDILVSCVGTGGTISGIAKKLKEYDKNIAIIAVEPYGSAVLSGENAGVHKIQGIGAGFIPKVMDISIVNEIIKVQDEDAYNASKELAIKEGMLVGISSGAAAHAAKVLAQRPENKSKTIVAIFPDTGERYLSSGLYD